MLSMGDVTVTINGLGPDTEYDVYCYTEDYAAHVMPLSMSIDYSVNITTDCCKSISFDMEEPLGSIPEISTASSNPEYSFTLSSRPSQTVIVTLNLTKLACADTSIGASPYHYLTSVNPSTFIFTGAIAESLTGAFTVRGYQGCYRLDLNTTYPNGQIDAYSVDSTEINIINQYMFRPATPALDQVVFSADGLNLNFIFDSPTNTPIFDNSSVFWCYNLVDFVGADNEDATCRWLSSMQLSASLSYRDGLKPAANAFDTGSVRAAFIQAECTISDCTDYEYMDYSVLDIEAPDDAIVPYVSLSSANSIGACDEIVLDPTGSTGHGGRSWESVVWSVAEFEVAVSNVSITGPIETWLNQQYNTGSKLAVVPNDLLRVGQKYTISLTLENFLGQSSTGSVYVEVKTSSAVPQLSIAGPSMLIKYRSQSLNLFAVATIPSCAGGVANEGITYEWKVYEGPTYRDDITSYSMDPRYFKIAPFLHYLVQQNTRCK